MSNLAKNATGKLRLAQWTKIIKDRAESGLTINDFCKQNSISRDAYYYWLRKVRVAAIKTSGLEFVELQEAAQLPAPAGTDNTTSAFITEATIRIGSMTISVNGSTPGSLLRKLLEVVSHVE